MDDWRVPAAAGYALLTVAAVLLLPGLVGAARGPRGQRPGVFGPLVAYELVRLARRGQQAKLRALFAVVLFLALVVSFLNQFRDQDPLRVLLESATLPIDRSASFAEQFLGTYLFCQLAALALVTPVFAGGGFTEDKDSGALDALRTSHLTNREIVYGKLVARLLFVLSLAFVGLPVLALTMLFGGIDGGVLVCGFVVALAAALSGAAFAVYLGTVKETLREVLYWSYGAAAGLGLFGFCCGACVPYLGVLSPFAATFLLLADPRGLVRAEPVELAVAFTAVHGLLAAFFVWLACRAVRGTVAAHHVRVAAAVAAQKKGRRVGEPRPRRDHRGPPRPFYVPRLQHNDPLLWKERYFSGRLPGFESGMLTGFGAFIAGIILVPIGMGLFAALLDSLASRPNTGDFLNPMLRSAAFAAAVGLAPLAGLRAAATVARERQRDTLTTLFTLPVDRADVLRAKWHAAFSGTRYWLYGAAAVGIIAVPLGGVHPVGLLVAAGLVVASVGFAVSLGLWLSVRCKTVARAVTQLLVVLAGLALGPHFVSTLVASAGKLTGAVPLCDAAAVIVERFSVPTAVYESSFRWDPQPVPGKTNPWAAAGGGAFAAGVYAAGAWAIRKRAETAFEADGR